MLLFDLLQSSLDHTLEMMLVGEVCFLFAQTWFFKAFYELVPLIPNPLVNWKCGLLGSTFTSVREIKWRRKLSFPICLLWLKQVLAPVSFLPAWFPSPSALLPPFSLLTLCNLWEFWCPRCLHSAVSALHLRMSCCLSQGPWFCSGALLEINVLLWSYWLFQYCTNKCKFNYRAWIEEKFEDTLDLQA